MNVTTIFDQCLNELCDFITIAPRMKDVQKLLRNLMVVEMLISILEKYDPSASYAL